MNKLYTQAVSQFQQNKLKEAAEILERLKDSAAFKARAHLLLGLIAVKEAKPGAAQSNMESCLEANPEDVATLQNLGRFFLQNNTTKLALDAFQRMEKIDTRSFEACMGLGSVYEKLNELDNAEKYLIRARTIDEQNIVPAFALGIVYRKQNKLQDAVASFTDVLDVNPEHLPALIQLGVLAFSSNDFNKALQYFRQAVEVAPDNLQALEFLAKTHANLKQYDAAVVCFKQLLENQPDSLAACLALAEIFRVQKKFTESERLLLNASKRFADNPQLTNKLARLMNDVGNYTSAMEEINALLARSPDNVDALNILGASLWQLGNYKGALAQFEKVISLAPDNAEGHFHRGFMLLLLGDYQAAWPEYEWRIKYFSPRLAERYPVNKSWQGQPLEGRTLLIRHEQGVGDFFMFVRFLSDLQARCKKIFIQLPEGTQRFFHQVEGVEVISRLQIPASYDYHVALPSLPGLADTGMDEIPGRFPYLQVSNDECSRLQKYISPGNTLNVGIVWAGNPDNPIDQRRSCRFQDLAPLLSLEGINFYSLQVGTKVAELDATKMTDLSPVLDDYASTAAAIHLLDVVVGVDTSVIHLAGALGKPMLVALPKIPPDWRWLLDRADSPWYPSAKLFRQSVSGDWEPVFAEIRQDLIALAQTRSAKTGQ